MNPYFIPGVSKAPFTLKADGHLDLKLGWLKDSQHGEQFAAAMNAGLPALGLPLVPGTSAKIRWSPPEWVPDSRSVHHPT